MKTKGCYSYLTESRNRDLIASFDRKIKGCGANCIMERVIRDTINSPSKRFWVTTQRAYAVIRTWENGGTFASEMVPLRKEMFEEIYSRVKALLRERPGMKLYTAVDRVVRQPAPKFYLTLGSAKSILSNIHHGKIHR